MPFPSPLTAGNLTTIRLGAVGGEGEYSATPYILVNPINIVFAAQVNQSIFGNVFAELEFDNVSTGVITDVLDGYSVYIGSTSDIRAAEFYMRARGDGVVAATTIAINESSNAIADDYYITVVKDVAIREKLGRYVNNVMTVDWDIAFRQLLPRVTELKSAYAQKLASAQADFTFPAVGLPTNSGATISSWLWNADGGSFINGTSATDAQPEIRYTVAGVYWPRVVVTDNGGRDGWFTMPVFVMSADMSDSWIIKGVEALSISTSLATGNEMRFTYFSDEMAAFPDRSFVALWNEDNYKTDTTPIIDKIKFVGRLRRENVKADIDNTAGNIPTTPFICEGILAQMNRLRSPQLALTTTVSPTEFMQIATMTQWRIVSFMLTEFSTVANVSSLSFDVEDNTYLNKEDSTDNQSLLASSNGILSALKSALNLSSQGELYAAHNANFQSDTARNALDTITTFTDNDLFKSDIPRDKIPAIGKIELFGGGYNSVDDTLRIIRSRAPAIASNEAQGLGTPVNGILLATDGTLAEQKTEAEQLVADSLAGSNPKDIPALDILDGYHFLSPTNFQWYGYLVAATDNNRNIVYTAADRLLLIGTNQTFDNVISSWDVSVTLSHETQGSGAQTISQVQPNAIAPGLPLLPSVPAYPGFPALDTIFLPTGWTPIQVPPIGQGGGAIVITPLEPFAQPNVATLKGSVVAEWDAGQVYLTTEFTETTTPNTPSIFTADGSMVVKDFKFDPHSLGAYVLVNDGAGNSTVWRTSNVFESNPTWTENTTTLEDIDYTTLKISYVPDRIYIFGIDNRVPAATVELLDGDGNAGLSPSDLVSPHAGSSNAAGTYDPDRDIYKAGTGSGGGRANNIEYGLPARADLDGIEWHATGGRSGVSEGERACEVSLDGVGIGGTNSFGLGTYPAQGLLMTKGPGLALSGSTLLFHASMDKPLPFAYAHIDKITLTLTDNGIPKAAYRRSSDGGDNFVSLRSSGAEIDPAAIPGFAVGAVDDFAYLAADDVLRESDDLAAMASKTGSATVGTYAKAVWAYGQNAQADMIIATPALFSAQSMIKIVADTPADITPNDGAFDGFVVSPNGICMSRISDEHMWGLFFFDTDIKMAYTDDGGDTAWNVSAESFTSGADHIRVKESNTNQLYIANSAVVKYSQDGGVTFEGDRVAPTLFLIGIEVR